MQSNTSVFEWVTFSFIVRGRSRHVRYGVDTRLGDMNVTIGGALFAQVTVVRVFYDQNDTTHRGRVHPVT